MKTLQYIQPSDINAIWNKVEEFIANGLKGANEYNVKHAKQYLLNGSQSLLAIIEDDNIVGAIVIEFASYPNERIAFVSSVGGKGIKQIWEQLISWCKQNGATVIRGCASEAIARLWRMQLGCQTRYLVVEKKL